MGIPLKSEVCSSRGGSVLCRVSSRIASARFALQQKPAAPGARGLTQGSRWDRLGVSAGKKPGARLQGLGRFHPRASLCSTACTAKVYVIKGMEEKNPSDFWVWPLSLMPLCLFKLEKQRHHPLPCEQGSSSHSQPGSPTHGEGEFPPASEGLF